MTTTSRVWDERAAVPSSLTALAPDELFSGRSLSEWADAWVRWSTAPTNCDQIPAYDEDGSLCALYQDETSPVFIFQTGFADTVRTRCTVPAGKALLVPLMSFFIDNVGRDEPLSDEALESESLDVFMSVRDLTLSIDGQKQELTLDDWKVFPTRSEYHVPSGTNVYSCAGLDGIAGKIEPSYYGGVFVMFKAPAPGMYTLEYGGALTAFDDDFVSVVSSTFVVQ